MLEYKNLSNYVDSIHKIKNEIYEDYINESQITARPGVFRLIKELKKNNISIALVSSTSEVNLLNLFTKGFRIDPYEMFNLVAHGDCTKLKKPSPEIYEWALQKLQLPSEACIAIEDSPRGLESSNNANIKTIVTPSKLTVDENFKDARLVISNLGEPDKPFDVISGKAFNHNFASFELLQKISKN